jgi:predicted AlkP superfamily pyrophosphatase or phosphodiesterase
MARRSITKRQEKLMKKSILINLEKYYGILAPSLKECNCSYYLHNKWLNEDDNYAKAIEEINQKTIDFVESKLFKLISEGDRTAIIFYLKCRAKDRGYVEKYQIDQTFIEPVKINYIYPDDENNLLLTDENH